MNSHVWLPRILTGMSMILEFCLRRQHRTSCNYLVVDLKYFREEPSNPPTLIISLRPSTFQVRAHRMYQNTCSELYIHIRDGIWRCCIGHDRA